MKLREKRQLICCFLVAILLVMGMQADIAPVNPFFLRGQKAPVSSTAYSVIRSGSYVVSVDENCTIDMIRRSTTTYQNSDYKSAPVRRFLKIAIILLVVEQFLLQRFYFGRAVDYVGLQSDSSQIATVRYIHQKDGKK